MRMAIKQEGKRKAGEYVCSAVRRQIMGWQNITAGGSSGAVCLTGMVGMKGGSLLFTKQTKDGYITCLSTPGHLWQVLAVEVPLSSQCDALPPTWLTLLSSRTRLCPNFCRKKCRKTGQRYHPVSLADRR